MLLEAERDRVPGIGLVYTLYIMYIIGRESR